MSYKKQTLAACCYMNNDALLSRCASNWKLDVPNPVCRVRRGAIVTPQSLVMTKLRVSKSLIFKLLS